MTQTYVSNGHNAPFVPTAAPGTNTAQAASCAFALAAATGGGPNPISAIYTAAGAINPADTLAIINSAASIAMTLAAGTDTHTVTINNHGAGVATITLMLDGSTTSVPMNKGDVLGVHYQATLATFIRSN